MKGRIVIVVFLLFVLEARAQVAVPDFVAASDEGYFELFEQKEKFEVVTFTSHNGQMVTDTSSVSSLKLFKKVYRPTILRRTSKLKKGWMGKEDVAFSSSKNYIYSLKFLKNGERDYWYLNGLDPYENYWCRTTEKVNYLIREHDTFDVVFTVREDKLGAFWVHHSKGPEGHSQRLFK